MLFDPPVLFGAAGAPELATNVARGGEALPERRDGISVGVSYLPEVGSARRELVRGSAERVTRQPGRKISIR